MKHGLLDFSEVVFETDVGEAERCSLSSDCRLAGAFLWTFFFSIVDGCTLFETGRNLRYFIYRRHRIRRVTSRTAGCAWLICWTLPDKLHAPVKGFPVPNHVGYLRYLAATASRKHCGAVTYSAVGQRLRNIFELNFGMLWTDVSLGSSSFSLLASGDLKQLSFNRSSVAND
jgi:hypothetical protein